MDEARINCLRCGNNEVAISQHARGENYVLFGCDDKHGISPDIMMPIRVAICSECGDISFLKAKDISEKIL